MSILGPPLLDAPAHLCRTRERVYSRPRSQPPAPPARTQPAAKGPQPAGAALQRFAADVTAKVFHGEMETPRVVIDNGKLRGNVNGHATTEVDANGEHHPLIVLRDGLDTHKARRVIAHECTHFAAIVIAGQTEPEDVHGPTFQRLARQIDPVGGPTTQLASRSWLPDGELLPITLPERTPGPPARVAAAAARRPAAAASRVLDRVLGALADPFSPYARPQEIR